MGSRWKLPRVAVLRRDKESRSLVLRNKQWCLMIGAHDGPGPNAAVLADWIRNGSAQRSAMPRGNDLIQVSRDALRTRLTAVLAPHLVEEIVLDVAGPEPKIKRGKGPDSAHGEKTIRRVLQSYLPPKMVDIIVAALGATLQKVETFPEPTEEARARARQRLSKWGIEPRR